MMIIILSHEFLFFQKVVIELGTCFRVCCLIYVSTDKFHVPILSDAKHEHTILPPTWNSSLSKIVVVQLLPTFSSVNFWCHDHSWDLFDFEGPATIFVLLLFKILGGNDNFYSFPLFENNNEFQIQISNGFFHGICVICFVYCVYCCGLFTVACRARLSCRYSLPYRCVSIE